MSISNYLTGQSTASSHYTLGQFSTSAATTPAAGTSATSPTVSGGNAATNAFFLSLSPQAQKYLTSIGLGSPSSAPTTAQKFILDTPQQQAMDDILAKYKNQPFTQATFDQLQDDLEAAGISPDQLAQRQQVQDFNPTMELLGALNDSVTDPTYNFATQQKSSSANYDTQKSNYIQDVIAAFQKVAAAA